MAQRAASDVAAPDTRIYDDGVSSLGHELRTGLAAINLWGSILRSGNLLPAEYTRAVDAILSSNASLGKQIEHLLDLLRLAAVSPPPRLEGVTVLLADADADTRFAMQASLEQAGARVLAADSAATALSLAEEADVPGKSMVLVSILGLPSVSGYELVTQLGDRRRNQQRPIMPACALSAHANDIEKQQAMSAGFDMLLAQPIAPAQLVRAVVDLSQVEGGSTPVSIA